MAHVVIGLLLHIHFFYSSKKMVLGVFTSIFMTLLFMEFKKEYGNMVRSKLRVHSILDEEKNGYVAEYMYQLLHVL